MLDKKAQSTLMLKLKFVRNSGTLDVTNSFLETVLFNSKRNVGNIDLRSTGDYKIVPEHNRLASV